MNYQDREMEASARDRWIWFVYLTNILGGPVFLVMRWWKERSPSRRP